MWATVTFTHFTKYDAPVSSESVYHSDQTDPTGKYCSPVRAKSIFVLAVLHAIIEYQDCQEYAVRYKIITLLTYYT